MGDHIAKLVERNRSQHHGSFLYEDPDWMRSAYHERGLTLRTMAVEAECGIRTIARWMETHGIPTDRSRIGSNTPRGAAHPNWKGGWFCETCGQPCTKGTREHRDCRDTRGEKNSKWRGDAVGYDGWHQRLAVLRGRADSHKCAHCSDPAEEWAYDHADTNELPAGISPTNSKLHGPYSTDPTHYMPLCKSCHRKFDKPAR